jgi:hypothetical protein
MTHPALRAVSPYPMAWACLACRRSFKRAPLTDLSERRTCPNCGANAIRLGRDFKAPAGDRALSPNTLREAREWVEVHRHQSLHERDADAD